MANPLLMQNEEVQSNALKKRKVDNGVMVDVVENQECCPTPASSDADDAVVSNHKLHRFQSLPLESNIDYITLQSSLDLLRSRAADLERNIHELANFKKTIKESTDLKQVSSLINNNSSYLDEISYKGCSIKSPSINWQQSLGLNLEKLNDDSTSYEEINDKYEIIKRDQLFN